MVHNQFISLVTVIQNPNDETLDQLLSLVFFLSKRFKDFEIIIIDNGSDYKITQTWKSFCEANTSLRNTTVFVLNTHVDLDIATCVGIELALGDLVCIYDLQKDSLNLIEKMVVQFENGKDVVLGISNVKINRSWITSFLRSVFLFLYRSLQGFSLEKEAPRFRLLSRTVVNFIFQYPKPENIYRRVPMMGGFRRGYVEDIESCSFTIKKDLQTEIKDNLSLIFSLDKNLLRLANFFCLLGATLNGFYSAYVVLSLFIKENIAEGWASLSLQQSGMFFLISIVLLLMSEFLLNNTSSSPKYFVTHEFKSARKHVFQENNIV